MNVLAGALRGAAAMLALAGLALVAIPAAQAGPPLIRICQWDYASCGTVSACLLQESCGLFGAKCHCPVNVVQVFQTQCGCIAD